MDFIPPLPCPKDAPLQLAHNLHNHLQLSLMDTYQSPEETPRCLQHKSPPPHSGRPLARLRQERINNDNNPQTTSKCLRTRLPSATRHSSHRHPGRHPTFIMAPPKRTSTTALGRPNRAPRCPSVMPWQQRMIEDPGYHSFVMLRVLRRKQPKQVSKQPSQKCCLSGFPAFASYWAILQKKLHFVPKVNIFSPISPTTCF